MNLLLCSVISINRFKKQVKVNHINLPLWYNITCSSLGVKLRYRGEPMTTNFISKTDKLFKDTLNDILTSGVSTEGHKVRPKYKESFK